MIRVSSPPRTDWRDRVESLGFDFHTIDNAPYWDETAHWRFTAAEIDLLEETAEELHHLCLQAVQHILDRDLLAPLGITGLAADLVRASWRRREPAFYGRFDLAWDGHGPPKMLEYNADTPTSLFEAAIVQWQWLEDVAPGADQFNSLHEGLVAQWRNLSDINASALHMACMAPHPEDEGTIRYLQATALEAGLPTKFISMPDIGWDGVNFVDLAEQPIRRLFKLYPWEWLVREPFAANIAATSIRMIEPAWKMLLSSKGLLAVLWQMFPDHPNLLPAAFCRDALPPGPVVRKPLFSREGANIAVLDGDRVIAQSDGPYGGDGWVWQGWTPLARIGTASAVLGLWMIGDKCHGLGMREDDGPITRDTSRFVPHLFHP